MLNNFFGKFFLGKIVQNKGDHHKILNNFHFLYFSSNDSMSYPTLHPIASNDEHLYSQARYKATITLLIKEP